MKRTVKIIILQLDLKITCTIQAKFILKLVTLKRNIKYVMWSSKISRKLVLLVLRLSQTNQKMSFASFCLWYPSTAHIFGTNWPISMSETDLILKYNNHVY